MARQISSGNYLKTTSPSEPGGTGTIFIRFKPNGWSSGVGATRTLWGYSIAAANTFCWYLANGGDNNIYVGWVIAGASARISLADTGIFADGVWANHVLDWKDTAPNGGHRLYVDNVLVGSSVTAFTVGTGITDLAVGTNSPKSDTLIDAHNGQGHVACFARWNRVLTSDERATLQSSGNPECVPDGLVLYHKILGDSSPEPDEIGSEDLTLVGSPAQSAHPTVNSCSGEDTIDLGALSAVAGVPSPAVTQPLSVNLGALAAAAAAPSPVLTMAAMSMTLGALSAAAGVPTIVVREAVEIVAPASRTYIVPA